MNGFDLIGNSKHVEKITPYPTEEERLEEEMNKPVQTFSEFGIRRRISEPESFDQAWERVRKLKWVRKNLKQEDVKKIYARG